MEEPNNQIPPVEDSQAAPQQNPPTSLVVAATLPSIKTLLSTTWETFRSRLIPSLRLQLLYFIPYFIAALLGYGATEAVSGMTTNNNPALIIIGVVLAIILGALFIAFSILVQAAQIIIFTLPPEEATIYKALQIAWGKLWKFFLTSVLAGMIIMGGFVLFIIPGIIFAVLFSLAVYIVLAEDRKPTDAIMASLEYVRGLWWPVAGRIAAILGLTLLIYMVIGFILTPVVLFLPSGADSILMNIANIFISPLLIAFPFVLYKQIRAAKGEVSPPATGRKKYYALAALGILIIPLGFGTSIVLLSLNSARVKSRDALRVSHIQQIQSALEIYYNETSSFPDSKNGQPVGLTPDYFTAYPQAPTPHDGECTEEDNQYHYSKTETGRYILRFCLGHGIGGLSAGIQEVGGGYETYEENLETTPTVPALLET